MNGDVIFIKARSVMGPTKAFELPAVQTPQREEKNAAQCFHRQFEVSSSFSFPLLFYQDSSSDSPWVYIWYKKGRAADAPISPTERGSAVNRSRRSEKGGIQL